MACFVQVFIVLALMLAVASRGNHHCLALRFERLNHSVVRIIGFVGKHRICNHIGQEFVCPIQVTRLSRGEMKTDGIAQCVHHGMNLGTQSTFAATNGFSFFSPPFAPALCWWARTIVASIIAYSLSASSALLLKHTLPNSRF